MERSGNIACGCASLRSIPSMCQGSTKIMNVSVKMISDDTYLKKLTTFLRCQHFTTFALFLQSIHIKKKSLACKMTCFPPILKDLCYFLRTRAFAYINTI